MRKYLAFDIEIAKPLPEGATDWKAHRPLGISCAATFASDESEPYTWYGKDLGVNFLPAMTQPQVADMVDYLNHCVKDLGYTLLTHNGVSFDFDILAEESCMLPECIELARNSIDTMLHFFCIQGYPVSLQALASGMGLPGKLEGVNGALVPELWAQGEYETVLKYVAQDVRTTLEVAQAVEREGCARWYSKSGRLQQVDLARWLTVDEALQLPEPNVAWMTKPLKRADFTAWMNEQA